MRECKKGKLDEMLHIISQLYDEFFIKVGKCIELESHYAET